MSTCIPTVSASASIAPPSLSLPRRPFPSYSHSNANGYSLSLSSNSIPKLRLFSQSSESTLTRAVAAKAQLNNVGKCGSSSAVQSNSEALPQEIKNGKTSVVAIDTPLTSEESIPEFITLVAGLVKLVESRDTVELQLKQHACELLIRTKDAIAPAAPAPVIMMQSPSPSAVAPQAIQAVSAPAPLPASSPPPARSAAKLLQSTVITSPWAGTFYRSVGCGEKVHIDQVVGRVITDEMKSMFEIEVGGKVQKGQVVCIVDGMKSMLEIDVGDKVQKGQVQIIETTNSIYEIQANHSGTIAAVLVEDGKPVSVGTPLFSLK